MSDKVEVRTATQLYEIADQLCDHIWSYDLCISEAMIIAQLVPTILNERMTRINMHKDLMEIE